MPTRSCGRVPAASGLRSALALALGLAAAACGDHGERSSSQRASETPRTRPSRPPQVREEPDPGEQDEPARDAGADASIVPEAGARDAGTRDAGPQDASGSDAARDAQVSDASDAATNVWTPATPAGPLPDCRVPNFAPQPARDARWLVLRGQGELQNAQLASLVQVSATGLSQPVPAGAIGADTQLGRWSSDGRHFAFQRTASGDLPGGIGLVTLKDAAPSAAVLLPGRLFDFVPGHSTLLASDVSLFKLYDADRPDQAPLKLPAPYGSVQSTAFSPDGHAFVFLAAEAPEPGLRRLTLDASVFALEAPFVSEASSPRWSPDGKRLVFNRSINQAAELWAAQWSDGKAQLRRVATGVNVNGASGSGAWRDATHLIWEDTDRRVHLAGIDGEQVSDTVLFTVPQQGLYRASPNAECIAVSGDCSGGSAPGLCVISTRMPALRAHVSNSKGEPVWQDSGARLALPSVDRIEVLNLDGAPFTPLLAAADADFDFVGQVAWAPNAAPWLSFNATSPGQPQGAALRLWSATSHTVTSIAPAGLSVQGYAWSPDAAYLAVIATERVASSTSRPTLLVQRVEAAALGPAFRAEGVRLVQSSSDPRNLVFQP